MAQISDPKTVEKIFNDTDAMNKDFRSILENNNT